MGSDVKDGTLRICLWSGPRNVSTALMYSFAQRPDTRVVDEPLYAYYLRRSGMQHPGREEVLAAQENDGRKVVEEVILGDYDRPVVFFKQMAHHLEGLDPAFLSRTTNVFLVRDPEQMLPSLRHQIPEPNLRDTGLGMQSELLGRLRDQGQDPPVIDSRLLLENPRGVLGELCARLGLPFHEEMLSWSPGARSEDGVWAPHWYHNVHRSNGFMPYSPKQAPFPEPLRPLLEECRPHYRTLLGAAIGGASSA